VRAAIGLGSNQGDSLKILSGALHRLNPVARSDLYQSTAWGPPQPDYYNLVAIIETPLAPELLLDELLTIERQWGRVRRQRWGPRTLDLDILLYEEIILTTPRLMVPHPHLLERNFALLPLAKLAPHWLHPVAQQSLAVLAARLNREGLVCLGPQW